MCVCLYTRVRVCVWPVETYKSFDHLGFRAFLLRSEPVLQTENAPSLLRDNGEGV